jgi:tetratricopeptide (TPR) repeat protein
MHGWLLGSCSHVAPVNMLRITLGILSLALTPTCSPAACKLSKIAELPVTMHGSQPLIHAKINGQEALFIADSGASFSMISPGSAAQYKLHLSPAPFNLRVMGVGGSIDAALATVREFTIAGVALHDVQFLVGGGEVGSSASVGLLGQNFFSVGDVEYDLAQGAIRLMHSEDCSHTRLAYWVTGDQPYSVMKIDWQSGSSQHTTGVAYLNGAKISVTFDSGASSSLLSMKAAERAGVKPDSPGVVDAGYTSGVGRGVSKTYIGRFVSFKIGDEEIRNTRLRFGEVRLETDMLLGADFFLSHRVYVANRQNKLFFTYNGGPVFNLSAASKSGEAAAVDELPDAAAYSRRGMALAARQDYEPALADLTRACQLSPDKAEYFYQRGTIYRDLKKPAEALADFDAALGLKGDDVEALAARAQLRAQRHDIEGAKADLALANSTAAKESDVRLFLANAYNRVDDLDAAVGQYDLWIAAHSVDSRMPLALHGRCRARALLGKDLSKALSDCDQALHRSPDEQSLLASIHRDRGIVRLRLGDYAKCIADDDAALGIEPNSAASLYGRGICEIRMKKQAEGESDIAAATKINEKVAEVYTRRGIVP